MTENNKKIFILGLELIVAAFIGLSIVFYYLGYLDIKSKVEIGDLSSQVTSLELERKKTVNELMDVKGKLNTIELDAILDKAEKIYTPKERESKEGLLWVDTESSIYVITLGALNGIKPGDKLKVYDGDKNVGEVVIDTALDVISYVTPVSKSLRELENKYFRVSVE